jgi:hypothetical protein
MSRYAHVAGLEIGGGIYTWDTDRTMLYAVGVGAGLHDNLDELQFTTENTPGVAQQVIPGFATVMNMAGDFIEPLGWGGPGEYPVGMVHGEQSVTLLQPIPPAGTVLSAKAASNGRLRQGFGRARRCHGNAHHAGGYR